MTGNGARTVQNTVLEDVTGIETSKPIHPNYHCPPSLSEIEKRRPRWKKILERCSFVFFLNLSTDCSVQTRLVIHVSPLISMQSVLISFHFYFYARKQLLLSPRLSRRNSVRPSVCLSVTRVDQSKTVQARITKSSPSAAWKTLVLGTVKLFHKFEGGHSERRR